MSDRILEYQKAARDAQQLYLVNVTCEDEVSCHGIYDTQDLAIAERDYYNANNRGGYYGRATIEKRPLLTTDLIAILRGTDDI